MAPVVGDASPREDELPDEDDDDRRDNVGKDYKRAERGTSAKPGIQQQGRRHPHDARQQRGCEGVDETVPERLLEGRVRCKVGIVSEGSETCATLQSVSFKKRQRGGVDDRGNRQKSDEQARGCKRHDEEHPVAPQQPSRVPWPRAGCRI
jgi:hypothetical protein